MLTIKGGKLVGQQGIASNAYMQIDHGKIVEPNAGKEGPVIHAENYYIAPGFIDPHVHGGIGYRYETDNVEELNQSLLESAKSGVTALCPALGLSTDELTMKKVGILKAHREVMKNQDGVENLGLHIEGPYCDVGNEVKPPDPKQYEKFLEYSDAISRWTLMPELDGAVSFMKALMEKNIYPSLGHCKSDCQCIQEALNLGVRHVTHLYTGMSGVYRDEKGIRRMGLIETALSDERLFAEVLCDGHHLDESMVRFIFKNLGTERFCVASDSHYREIKEGETFESISRVDLVQMKTRSALMSQMPFHEMVRWLYKTVKLSLPEIVQITSHSTAKSLKVENRKGKLQTGYDADVVIFDENINIKCTIARGKIVYNNL